MGDDNRGKLTTSATEGRLSLSVDGASDGQKLTQNLPAKILTNFFQTNSLSKKFISVKSLL